MGRPTKAFAAFEAAGPLGPFAFERRAPGPAEIAIDVLYCGVCHSDLLSIEVGGMYPCVPGHEIVGRVSAVGADVTRFKIGDFAAVGAIAGSCRRCPSCDAAEEQYCDQGFVSVFNAPQTGGGHSFGGFSDHVVIDEHYALSIRAEASKLPALAPLLCAGITTWSPLRHWGVGSGSRLGVVGLGGLGHMAVKLGRALGAEVIVFTTSEAKRDDAMALGASAVVVSTDPQAMAAQAGQLDFILNTVAVPHDLDAYVATLKRDGTMTLVGLPLGPHPPQPAANLIWRRRSVAGSLLGGIAETQELIDFCLANDVAADVELIPIQEINTAFERMLKNDVRYRFVIDMQSLA